MHRKSTNEQKIMGRLVGAVQTITIILVVLNAINLLKGVF